MKGNNSIFLRQSFFPRYALGMPSFINSALYLYISAWLSKIPWLFFYFFLEILILKEMAAISLFSFSILKLCKYFSVVFFIVYTMRIIMQEQTPKFEAFHIRVLSFLKEHSNFKMVQILLYSG